MKKDANKKSCFQWERSKNRMSEKKIQFGGKRARLKLISIILSYLIPMS